MMTSILPNRKTYIFIKSQKVRQETFFLDVRLAALKSHLQSKHPLYLFFPSGLWLKQGGVEDREGIFLSPY